MHRLQQWCIRAANAITDLFDRRVVPEEQLQTTTTPPIDHRQKNTRTDNAKGVDSNGFTPNDNNNVDIESNVWKPIARPASGSNDLRRDIFYTALEQQTPISNIQSMPMIPPTLPLVPSSFQLSPVVSQSFPTSSITTRRLQWTQPPPPAQQTNYYSQYDTLEEHKNKQQHRNSCSPCHLDRLIKKMGSSVGQEFNAKPIESRTMPIPLFIRDIELIKGTRSYNIRRIEKYSGTTLTFFKSHRLDPTYHLRIDGSVEQQYFALQALNAVIAETHPTRKYYILLKVTGFKLQEVHTRINHVLEMTTMGQAYQINHSDLHITVAFLNLETSEGLDCLRTTLETAANDLREAYHNDGIRYGHLDAIAKCNENYMSLKPRNGNDSLYWIRDVIWKRMKRNRIIPQNAIPPMLHMTIARKTRKNKMNAYNPYGVPLTQHFLDSLNVDVDFGPIRVSAITIDEVTRSMNGSQFVNIESYPTL